MNEKIIRYGIVCSGSSFTHWQSHVLSSLNRNSLVVPVVILVNGKVSKAKGRIGIKSFLPTVPMLKCGPRHTNDNSIIDKFKEYSPDFIIKFGNPFVAISLLGLTPLGVWEFRFGSLSADNIWPSGFYEVYHRKPVTPAYLVRLNGNGTEAEVLIEAHYKTRDTLKANRENLLQGATNWPAKVCQSILSNKKEIFTRKIILPNPVVIVNPGIFAQSVCFFNLLSGRIYNKFRLLLYTDFWNIGVAKAPISEFLTGNQPVVEWLPLQNRKKFFADPFALRDERDKQKYHIFCETYSFKTAKGIIEHLTWEPGFGREVSPVMEDSLHLSYPYIFEEDGHRYMIPEHYQSGRVSVYEATDFPLKWERKGSLIENFSGIDSTLVKWNDLYWLFSSNRKDGYTFKINLFYAETIMGPWIAHPQNPVKTDVRSSRSAGTPFVFEGKLYRPSMDYSGKLQGKIVINRVEKLSKTEFEEVAVKDVLPYTQSPYPHKIHTLSAMGDYTLVDGSREVCILTDAGLLMYNLKLLWGKLLKLI